MRAKVKNVDCMQMWVLSGRMRFYMRKGPKCVGGKTRRIFPKMVTKSWVVEKAIGTECEGTVYIKRRECIAELATSH